MMLLTLNSRLSLVEEYLYELEGKAYCVISAPYHSTPRKEGSYEPYIFFQKLLWLQISQSIFLWLLLCHRCLQGSRLRTLPLKLLPYRLQPKRYIFVPNATPPFPD